MNGLMWYRFEYMCKVAGHAWENNYPGERMCMNCLRCEDLIKFNGPDSYGEWIINREDTIFLRGDYTKDM